MADNHSMNFEPEEEIPSQSIIVSVIFVIIAILGLIGNGLVLFVIAKVPDLRSITNILIGHQSFVDFVSSLLLMLVFFPPAINLVKLNEGHPTLANFICKLWSDQFFYWAVIKVSTVNLVCLTIERYFAVIYPHNYRQRASRKGVLLVCLLAWIIGPLSEVYFLFTFNVNEKGQCAKKSLSRGGEYAIAFLVFTFTLVIPLGIMAFVYVSIIRALRSVKPAMKTSPTAQLNHSTVSLENVTTMSTTVSFEENNLATLNTGNEDAQVNGNAQAQTTETSVVKTARERIRRNILTTMFLVSLTYAVCWAPNQILYFYYNLVSQTDFTGSFYLFTVILAGFNVCINPIIYAFKYRKFQQALRQLFLKQVPTFWERTTSEPS